MTRQELEHVIRAACDVAEDDEVYVFGSQAVLGQYPDVPVALRQSMEADVVPKNRPDRVDHIDAMLGELTQFHRTHGFYAHGVPLETVILSPGWIKRTVRVQNENTLNRIGWCLEVHDLAASKLAAFRDRDREFVRLLIVERLVDASTLVDRLAELPVEAEHRSVLAEWVRRTEADLGRG